MKELQGPTLVAAAIVNPNQIAIDIPDSMFKGSSLPAIWAIGIDTTKKVYLWKEVRGSWEEVFDGTNQEEFNITQTHLTAYTPGRYGFTKDLTAGTVEMTVQGVA